MATENQRVVAYLANDEMAELKSLSESWGLSLSKTIARLVREVGTPRSDNVPSSSVTDIVALVDDKVDTLRKDNAMAIANLADQLTALAEDVEAIKNPSK